MCTQNSTPYLLPNKRKNYEHTFQNTKGEKQKRNNHEHHFQKYKQYWGHQIAHLTIWLKKRNNHEH